MSVKYDIVTIQDKLQAYREKKKKEYWDYSMGKRAIVTSVEGGQDRDKETY